MMKALRRTIFEVLVLGIAGVVVAFAYNAVRADGSIKPLKNYFDRGETNSPDSSPKVNNGQQDSGPKEPDDVAVHPKHSFQEILLADVIEILSHPDTEMGLNVFVDARRQDAFEEGHIPGAVRCDPYETEDCIDEVLNVALAADKVVVYCGGGDCEDSVFMCRELFSAGIEHDALFLYAGGWAEWIADGQPVEQEMED